MKKTISLLILVTVFVGSIVLSSCNKNKDPEAPEVSFSITNNYMKAPFSINFTNTSIQNDYELSGFSWDFDDGSSSEEENPTHEYTEPGFYTADLLVTTNTDETFGYSKNIIVYGNIIGWLPDIITFYPDKILAEGDTLDLYIVVRNEAGEALTYTSDGNYRINNGVTTETSTVEIYIYDVPQLNLASGSYTFELREFSGEDYVYPDTDPLIYSCTVSTNDIVPTNENGPYLPQYIDGTNKFYLEIDWVEE